MADLDLKEFKIGRRVFKEWRSDSGKTLWSMFEQVAVVVDASIMVHVESMIDGCFVGQVVLMNGDNIGALIAVVSKNTSKQKSAEEKISLTFDTGKNYMGYNLQVYACEWGSNEGPVPLHPDHLANDFEHVVGVLDGFLREIVKAFNTPQEKDDNEAK